MNWLLSFQANPKQNKRFYTEGTLLHMRMIENEKYIREKYTKISFSPLPPKKQKLKKDFNLFDLNQTPTPTSHLVHQHD